MLLFRKLEEAFHTVKANLQSELPEDVLALELKKMKLLSNMIAYTKSCQYLKHEQIKLKLRAFLQSKYDYQSVAQRFGVSLNSLQVSISYASKCLSRKIGNTLHLLLQGDIAAAEREFLLGTGQSAPAEWFLEGIMVMLPAPKLVAGVDMSAAAPELRFLKLVTKSFMTDMIQSLDPDRLMQLLYILLRNDKGFTSERGAIIQYLNGEMKLAEAMKRLQSDSVYSED